MPRYQVQGYCKMSGARKTIIVEASTTKHARTVAYDRLARPKVTGKQSR